MKSILFMAIMAFSIVCTAQPTIHYVFNMKHSAQVPDGAGESVDGYTSPIGSVYGVERGLDFIAVDIDREAKTILVDHISHDSEYSNKVVLEYTSVDWLSYGVKQYNCKDGFKVTWNGTALTITTKQDNKFYVSTYWQHGPVCLPDFSTMTASTDKRS